MRHSVEVVYELVERIGPVDEIERTHREDTLRWLESTDDVFRRVKPATPDRHLVSYVALFDPDGGILLVDHVNAGLWLPPGGHVEPDEHPARTARREALEELGVDPPFAADVTEPAAPCFVTITRTVGRDRGHVDVSLWFVFAGHRDMPIVADRTEFRAVRWWTPAEVYAESVDRFDPHFRRFMAKRAASSE
jgi:8-oxo-dGTP diphosphatase